MREVFLVFLRLGLTSFGGPIAHLAYFRDEFVARRRWLDDERYLDLVALCQFLPGPASSQVGIALGMQRAGYAGALAAWLAFTLPSAVALVWFAQGLARLDDALAPGVLNGLKLAALAVVAHAVWSMARPQLGDPRRLAILAATAGGTLLFPGPAAQVGLILAAAALGLLLFPATTTPSARPRAAGPGRKAGRRFLLAFALLLAVLPLLERLAPSPLTSLIDAFYRAGSLVFGGGHVVLPLLQAEVVGKGWLGESAFLAGYGAAQAVPGPLFTFAAYLGAAMDGPLGAWPNAAVCLVAIFLPAFLLVLGSLPFWETARHHARARAALTGVNAAVVGLLLATLYPPVRAGALASPWDFGIFGVALLALFGRRAPAWLIVLLAALAGGMTGN